MTLAGEDAYSKMVEVVIVANVDDENRVISSLLLIWKLRFCHKAKLVFRCLVEFGIIRAETNSFTGFRKITAVFFLLLKMGRASWKSTLSI